MTIRFNLTGAERKALVQTVGEILGWEPVYKKAPSFAYAIGDFVIDKEGALIAGGNTDRSAFASLLERLAERGFVSEDTLGGDDVYSETIVTSDSPVSSDSDADDSDRLVIELPLEGFTTAALDNLEKLVASKAALIRKAVGADDLPIEQTDGKLRFPWFTIGALPEEVNAYARFVGALCASAKAHNRVTAREKTVDNEKYAMRCFLLRLGFIGEEYASARKILLSKMFGDSSFKSGKRKESLAESSESAAETHSEGNPHEAAPDDLAEALADAALIHEVNALMEVSNG